MTMLWEKIRAIFGGETPGFVFAAKLCSVLHVYDDLIDRDKPVSPEDIHKIFWFALVDLQIDPFFQKHKSHLLPILQNAIFNWRAANVMESLATEGDLQCAYQLRTTYIDLISNTLALERGFEYSLSVTRLLRVEMASESFETYQKNLRLEKEAAACVSTQSLAEGLTFQIPTQPQGLKELRTAPPPSGTQALTGQISTRPSGI